MYTDLTSRKHSLTYLHMGGRSLLLISSLCPSGTRTGPRWRLLYLSISRRVLPTKTTGKVANGGSFLAGRKV